MSRYNFNLHRRKVQMSAAPRINVDATISRKSEYKCHWRFKDSYINLSSYSRVACATEENRNSFPRTKPGLSRSCEKYACRSIIVKPFPDTIKHDVANCSYVAKTPCFSPFSSADPLLLHPPPRFTLFSRV